MITLECFEKDCLSELAHDPNRELVYVATDTGKRLSDGQPYSLEMTFNILAHGTATQILSHDNQQLHHFAALFIAQGDNLKFTIEVAP